jgi:multidrug efflux system membrane fusion protein
MGNKTGVICSNAFGLLIRQLVFLVVLVGMVKNAFAEMPAASVSVATVEETVVTEWQEFTGRLTAVDAVALRPRVSGQLQQVYVEEGALVEAGQVLFEIDDRPFKAVLNQAKADLNRANTEFEQAQREAKRGKALLQRKVISKEEHELRLAASAAALAQREAARAALELAQLDVEFTRVVAPVSGRLGLAEITEGNWVQAGQTLLTTLVAADRLYVDFVVDERTFLLFGSQWTLGETPVKLGLVTDEDYPYHARLTFIDNQVNARTGTIQLRASLADTGKLAGKKLRPGFFARAAIPTKGPYDGLLINERAVATDQGTRYVLTLGEGNVATYTPVTLGPRYDGLRIVRSGLQPGMQVIVKGLMRAQPGAPVVPTQVNMRHLTPLASAEATAPKVDEVTAVVLSSQ